MSRAQRGNAGPVEAIKNNIAIGAGLGAAAFVVNYVLMYVFAVVIDGVETSDEGWKQVGNLLYNSHFVDTELSGGGMSASYNLVTGSSPSSLSIQSEVTSTIPSIVYHAVPLLVLLAAGLFVVRQAQVHYDAASAAAAGATIVAGYIVLAVVGVFLFEVDSGSGSAAPEMVPAIALAGLAIPLVLGAVGGVIGNEV